MDLSQQALDEFKAIYKKDFGEDLTDAQAEEYASRLLRFYEIVTRHSEDPPPLPPVTRPRPKRRPSQRTDYRRLTREARAFGSHP